MSSALFDRAWAVTVDSLRVTGLRIQFRVAKSLAREPNTIDLSITNLSAESRAAMKAKGARVIVEAGYASGTEVLFVGDARTISHAKKEADWLTRIQCGDGEAALASARSNTSFGPGTATEDVLGRLAKDMGVGLGNAIDEAGKGNFRQALDSYLSGAALFGKTATEFDRVARSAGLEWSIQNGELQVLRPGATTAAPAVRLSRGTGLIGSPEPAEDGLLKAKSLLQPGLRPGRRVLLDADAVKGLFRVERVVHSGDSSGTDWYSEAELRRL